MYDIRTRIKTIFLTNFLLMTALFAAIHYHFPEKNVIAGNVFYYLAVAVVFVSFVEGFIADYYIKKIMARPYLEFSEEDLEYLLRCSIFKLRKRSLLLDSEFRENDKLIKSLMERAANCPDLLAREKWRKLVYSFKFAEAEKILENYISAKKVALEKDCKKISSIDSRLSSLCVEGAGLGIPEVDLNSARDSGVTALRDLVEQARISSLCKEQAENLGCYSYVGYLLKDESVESAQLFLLRAKILLERSVICGVTSQVKEFISLGNLDAADNLIRNTEEDLKEIKELRLFEEKIELLPALERPHAKMLLMEIRNTARGSRERRVAVYYLDSVLNLVK